MFPARSLIKYLTGKQEHTGGRSKEIFLHLSDARPGALGVEHAVFSSGLFDEPLAFAGVPL